MNDLVQDLRYALRHLRKNPGFAAVAILTIAVGIGASTTIFTRVRSVLLNPLPGAGEPSRALALEMLTPSGEWTPTFYLDFRDFRNHLRLPDSMTVACPMYLAVGNEASVERIWGEVLRDGWLVADPANRRWSQVTWR